MADNSIALGVQVPDAMKNISGMLNFAGQAQNLQNQRQNLLNAQQQFQKGGIELEKERIQLGERKAIQDLFSDPSKFNDNDGNFDYNKLVNEGMKVAPTTFPTMVPQIIQAHKSSLEAKRALNDLDSQQRGAVGQFVMSLAGDEPKTVLEKMSAFAAQYPQLKAPMQFAWQYQLLPNAGDPAKFKDSIFAVGRSAMNPSEQKEALTPSGVTVSDNASTRVVNTNPTAGAVGQVIPGTSANMQIPLDVRQTVVTNPVTQSPQVVTKDAFGNVQSVTQAPTGPGVPTFRPGQVQDIPIVTEMRAKVNSAAAQVPTQRFNNRQIMNLVNDADALNLTGAGAQTWAKLSSAIGVPFSGDRATRFNQLAHYMAIQAQANSAAMNAGTDAARALAQQVAGSTDWTPEAIAATAKVNDALSTGLAAFNQGMESAIRNAGGDISAARDFQNKWSQVFDPDVYRYANAKESGDAKEIDKILGKPGTPERAARARALAEKSAMLYRLTTGQ